MLQLVGKVWLYSLVDSLLVHEILLRKLPWKIGEVMVRYGDRLSGGFCFNW